MYQHSTLLSDAGHDTAPVDPGIADTVSETAIAYLRTVYNLAEDGVPARRARLCDRLGLSSPTVSQMVGRLRAESLIRVTDDRQVELTATGLTLAVSSTRKHRLAERILVDMLGVPILAAHDEACRWAQVMSDEAAEGAASALIGPLVSPWGNPIPERGDTRRPAPAAVRLPDLPRTAGAVSARVRSISEDAQGDDALMADLVAACIVPGAKVMVTAEGTGYALRGIGTVAVPRKRAHVVQVDLD
ncbi:metal-dependent transcriptional regulator [Gordonia pseudamarae]|jgi:DtxR family Mn-dependent transcriptional regulator|uniref:Metal-dependent transcriptional regulator n=1 Tax=Gordonia pseudamarae TaxID=2831662 RepID=A0ABX6IKX0_9ACTN|nr:MULTISPECIES: metal-dependent transcriptional regulator [Gordonia]MBD0020637.1 metal-dependent transcriptional regulator [Gordonia sp. (in: high G+C Gram-positive bacteria)]QHN27681.1 metal-dependent transcriptional regulator [Gordonia pseudamarae]QHN36563.1 metal-dependent transcriptional regulator [Gordonia pseudamarae]